MMNKIAQSRVFVFLLTAVFFSHLEAQSTVVTSALAPAYGLVQPKSSKNIAFAQYPRLVTLDMGFGTSFAGSKIVWYANYAMGYNLTLGVMDFTLLRVGAQNYVYEPALTTWGGRAVRFSKRNIEPYWSVYAAHVTQTSTIINTTSEVVENLDLVNLGLSAGTGLDYKNYKGEILCTVAPFSLSRPANSQYWFSLLIGYKFTL